VALRYAPLAGEAEPPPGDLWPRVARYARGVDYHDLIRRGLAEVAAEIESEWPGTGTRICVDTAPLLERELAARAGLGAIGKNTNLLNPEVGSWFLLGELLLTLDLPADDPVSDLCGRCTRCLDACPTGALREPWRLDARRCISYWTIEHRGEIPEEMRPALAEWVFGCDVCQEVCPWNGKGEPAEHPELAVPGTRRELDLVGLLELEEADYRERFRGSPMKRARLEGLGRNAALALAGRREPRTVAALARAAEASASAVVRATAAWAAARTGPGADPVD
jgi:epoxyqueuosine reductase